MIRITQSNLSGFGSVSGDELNLVSPPIADTYLPTVYEAASFSIDLLFEGGYDDGDGDGDYPLDDDWIFLPATNITTSFNWSAFGLTFTKLSDSTCRISGSHLNPFPNQYYRFVLPDMSLQVLPGDTPTEFYSLEKYQMPSPVSIMRSMTISVTIPADPILGGSATTQTVTLDQWIHWYYPSAVASIAAARTRGLK
jgi:hypothetical protein